MVSLNEKIELSDDYSCQGFQGSDSRDGENIFKIYPSACYKNIFFF